MIRPARPDDVPAIYRLIRDLADYERAADEVRATPRDIASALFGEHPAVFAHVAVHGPADPADPAGRGEPGAEEAEKGGEVVGFALWFYNFSTWLGRHGIYLEDLYVRPEMRGRGYGRALLAELARVATERGCGRLEWWVLDWNLPAISFYRSLGAEAMDEWTVYRISGPALHDLAKGSSIG